MSSADFVPFEYSMLHGCRAVLRPGQCALLPRVFRVESWLPNYADTDVHVLASAELGARFVENELLIRPGGGTREPEQNGRLQAFLYVVEGAIHLTVDGKPHDLDTGGYAWLPPGTSYAVKNNTGALSRVIQFRRKYIPARGLATPGVLVSNQRDVPGMPEGTCLAQYLIPFEQDRGFDLAFNILSFPPSVSFDKAEIHIFEHGAYFLTGRGTFWIGGEYYDVRVDDFAYFAAYVPHFVSCQGDETLSYLLYKNVNRDPIEDLPA
jgi:(S)-ureidoglycine aminohydrolase